MQEKKKNITGDDQASFAGTNPDRYGEPAPADQQDNPVADEEAQNVTDGQQRLEGTEAERARNKANESKRQEK
jgi:hypothetical protein